MEQEEEEEGEQEEETQGGGAGGGGEGAAGVLVPTRQMEGPNTCVYEPKDTTNP